MQAGAVPLATCSQADQSSHQVILTSEAQEGRHQNDRVGESVRGSIGKEFSHA